MSSFKWQNRSRPRRSRARLGNYAATSPAASRVLPPSAKRSWYVAKVPAVILLLGAVWLVGTFFLSNRFALVELSIEGMNGVPLRIIRPEDVQGLAHVAGSNVLLVNATELSARLKSEFGVLDQVDVRPQLPNRLTIRLREQEAVFIWESGGQYWWVDDEGRVLGKARDTDGLIVVHDSGGQVPEPSEHISEVPWGLAQAMVRALPVIKSFDYALDKGLVVYVTARQWPVYLGHGGDAEHKSAVMESLVDQLVASKGNVDYIDLRHDERPNFRKSQ